MRKLFPLLSLCLCMMLFACGGDTATPVPPTATAGSGAVNTPAVAAATNTTTTASTSCTGQLTHVVFATGFTPNVQYAPYYMAADKGYYAAECLDVEFKYGQVANVAQLVSDGQIQFMGTSGDSLISARLAGANITYIMAVFQKYPVGALALNPTDSGFTLSSPADLKGRNVGVSGPNGPTYVGLLALLKQGGLTINDVKVTSIGFTEVEALVKKQVDLAMTFLPNESEQMKAMGYKIQTLTIPTEANLISSGIATGDKLIKENPKLVQGFVRATLHGLKDTLANPDAAFDATMKRMTDITADKIPVQKAVMTATLDYEQAPAGHPLGWSNPDGWKATQDLLMSVKLIDKTADPATFYTNQFAEAANP